jgi:hypothetical protein
MRCEAPTVRLAATQAVEEAKDLRVGGGGRAGSGEDAAIRRTKRDGCGGEVRGSALAWAGWVVVRPAVGLPEVEKTISSTTGNH